jgi:hypothetical protein
MAIRGRSSFSADGRDLAIGPPGSGQLSASLHGMQQPLPGSTASLNSSILCNVLTDLHFGNILGTGSFGE